MESAKLMSKRMIYSKESVCKSHTSHAGSVCHMVSCLYIISVSVSSWKIIKYQLDCFQSKTVCIVRSHYGNICLDRVSHNVNTGSAGQAFRCAHHVVCVNNSHVRHQFIVCQRPFDSCFFVCNNGKRSYLRTCTGRCWDCYKVSFFTHFREGIDSLADIHEIHCHIVKISVRILIKHPHNFSGIHCRTTAKSDNAVRLKGAHCCCSGFCRCKRRIRLYIRKTGVYNAHLIQFILNRLCISVFVKERVGYDKAAFFAHNSSQLIKGNRHTAFFEVNLFRGSHPEHVLSPLCNSFNIDQMLYSNVFRNRVSAPGAAAQSKGWNKLKVIKISDSSLGGWCIYKNTAGFHSCCMFCHFFLLIYIDIKRRSMSVSAVSYQLFSLCKSLVKVFCLIHGKYRRKLFVSKFFADVHRLNLANKDLCFSRNSHTGHFCDCCCFLTYDLRIQRAVNNNCFSYLVKLILFQEVAASVNKLFFYCLIYAFQYSNRLLGSADHTIVKGF